MIVPQIRKLKDGNSNFVWEPGLKRGDPERLLGKPLFINQDMASTLATTNVIALYGAFEKYKIREVASPTLSVLVERYAEYLQTGFVITRRVDADLNDPGGAVRKLVMA